MVDGLNTRAASVTGAGGMKVTGLGEEGVRAGLGGIRVDAVLTAVGGGTTGVVTGVVCILGDISCEGEGLGGIDAVRLIVSDWTRVGAMNRKVGFLNFSELVWDYVYANEPVEGMESVVALCSCVTEGLRGTTGGGGFFFAYQNPKALSDESD
jgi:hypothetical protein